MGIAWLCEEAISFYNKHPEETLIIVTADHETGGLKIPGSKGSDKNEGLVLTDYEFGRIKSAYEKTIKNDKNRNQMEYDIYGTHEPLAITITHIEC